MNPDPPAQETSRGPITNAIVEEPESEGDEPPALGKKITKNDL